MKIGCVNVYDTKNRNAFGGRLYGMVGALEQQASELHHLGPLHHRAQFMPMIVAKKVFYKFT